MQSYGNVLQTKVRLLLACAFLNTGLYLLLVKISAEM